MKSKKVLDWKKKTMDRLEQLGRKKFKEHLKVLTNVKIIK